MEMKIEVKENLPLINSENQNINEIDGKKLSKTEIVFSLLNTFVQRRKLKIFKTLFIKRAVLFFVLILFFCFNFFDSGQGFILVPNLRDELNQNKIVLITNILLLYKYQKLLKKKYKKLTNKHIRKNKRNSKQNKIVFSQLKKIIQKAI
ncbi:hypothetical protein M0811_04642 [Anaeramoeba ignava]|uniref:Transmembrane protein n=1 Tax=Anaeramoeba ignava TaxID=1746090 RepID=A0A9Q0LUT5_ANAIG|nr:hypothetical protein M0811_04642 [Anaeramoeba ignava]